jgi:hypothetical protein
MKLQGGMDMEAGKYEPEIQALALELIGHTRDVVKLPSDAEKGARFNNTTEVLWRLESMFTEDDFLGDTIHTIELALLDAAKADYWYANEKEWDTEVVQDEYEFQGDAC